METHCQLSESDISCAQNSFLYELMISEDVIEEGQDRDQWLLTVKLKSFFLESSVMSESQTVKIC
eukprot:scaffold83626_cov28-Cyclotella_meneghiniana.AAC.4